MPEASKLALAYLQSGAFERQSPAIPDALQAVRRICRRFHQVALQLTHRRESRATPRITDEYDLQDLLHALLKVGFDDIRPEEWTPSTGGACARMDFLLRDENIVLEAKMTSGRLKDKELFDQLTQDVARYHKHPKCRLLVCLIYDPGNHVKNPLGLEKDVTQLSSEHLHVGGVCCPWALIHGSFLSPKPIVRSARAPPRGRSLRLYIVRAGRRDPGRAFLDRKLGKK